MSRKTRAQQKGAHFLFCPKYACFLLVLFQKKDFIFKYKMFFLFCLRNVDMIRDVDEDKNQLVILLPLALI